MKIKLFGFILAFLFIFCNESWAAEKIIYSSLVDGYWQIYIMDTDGSHKQQLTNSLVDKKFPVYLKNSNKILYKTSNNEFFLINSDGSDTQKFLSDLGSITDAAYNERLKKIVFSRFRQETLDNSDIWMSDIDGNNLTILTNDWGLQYCPSFSSDAKKIVYTSGHGFGTHEIYTLDLDTKKSVRLTEDQALDFFPVFSPNGKKIAYVSDVSGNYDIWIMNIDGSKKTQITKDQAMDTRPFWAPSGKEIVFTSTRSGNLQIWKMDKTGNNFIQLTFDQESQHPFWAGEFE
ncbi:MAG: DUF5050 domain-containing protein [Candidatus Omnitrophica bacterium]|nr:DUF5050 domain-containing protein [Candidatus Omnitrophota bacterium]